MRNNEKLILVIKEGRLEDQTERIDRLHNSGKNLAITYKGSDKTYFYSYDKVQCYDLVRELTAKLYLKGHPLRFEKAYDYDDYVKIFNDGRSRIYAKPDIEIGTCMQHANREQGCMLYFKSLAALLPESETLDETQKNEDHTEEDPGKDTFINRIYQKVEELDKDSVLSYYLRAKVSSGFIKEPIIYPFGCNASQKEAVRKALTNNISVIEGPPGTGKTQTILNIVANVVMKGQRVAVVSGNNSAVANVKEKLEKNGYGFLSAMLGNKKNKELFFKERYLQELPPESWKLTNNAHLRYTKELEDIEQGVNDYLHAQNALAIAMQSKSQLEVEYAHYSRDISQPEELDNLFKSFIPSKWSAQKLLEFKAFCETHMAVSTFTNLFTKARLLFSYRVYPTSRFYTNSAHLLQYLDGCYYLRKIAELQREIDCLQRQLESTDYAHSLQRYSDVSTLLFRNDLYSKYSKAEHPSSLELFDRSEKEFNCFIARYPVLLSTTHSILNSRCDTYLFDYLIIDEASQVDILTAVLAFSCCKNIVVIGDSRQLPHIISSAIDRGLFEEERLKYSVAEGYDYVKHSVLSSLKTIYKKRLPITLLKEHYRCHPAIIQFCNQRFYNNELVIMTKDEGLASPFVIYNTNKGNHCRSVLYKGKRQFENQRQMDVVTTELLPAIDTLRYKEFGIISPYRYQADCMRRAVPESVEVDTIHKFQGREKDVIAFMTVCNEINDFLDDANLINVAVSRAKNTFIIVKPGDMHLPHSSHLGSLIRYINYHSPQAEVQSNVNSIFDLLYKAYEQELSNFRKRYKQDSTYDSENLMRCLLEKILMNDEDFSGYDFSMHYPLSMLFKPGDLFTDEETTFIFHTDAHVDFLVYNRADKSPVMGIEVNGHTFHSTTVQQLRDAKKAAIFKKSEIPLVVFETTGSNEEEILRKELKRVSA